MAKGSQRIKLTGEDAVVAAEIEHRLTTPELEHVAVGRGGVAVPFLDLLAVATEKGAGVIGAAFALGEQDGVVEPCLRLGRQFGEKRGAVGREGEAFGEIKIGHLIHVGGGGGGEGKTEKGKGCVSHGVRKRNWVEKTGGVTMAKAGRGVKPIFR